MSKLIWLSTKEFSKLPDCKLYLLKVTISGMKSPLYFKSKSVKKIHDIIMSAYNLYGESVDIENSAVTCKDTIEFYDEDCSMESINSYKGKLL